MKVTISLVVDVVVKDTVKRFPEPTGHKVVAVLLNGKNIKDDLNPETLAYIQNYVNEDPIPF